jgi:uncharacterized membrane protein YjfL (UPF0719 family)
MCKQTREEIAAKQELAKKNIWTEITTSILVLVFLFIAKIMTKNLSIRYDENNVTPSDYTLYFAMGEKQSSVFDKVFY